VRVVKNLSEKNIFFVPDRHLGTYVAEMLSENMLEEGNINWLEPVAPDGYAIAVCVQGGNLWEDC